MFSPCAICWIAWAAWVGSYTTDANCACAGIQAPEAMTVVRRKRFTVESPLVVEGLRRAVILQAAGLVWTSESRCAQLRGTVYRGGLEAFLHLRADCGGVGCVACFMAV